MRTLFAAALLLVSAIAAAQDAPKPLSIALEPLGDRDGGVVTRVVFRFANPRAITDAGLFLEGSFRQAGKVPRSFRYAVPRKRDRMVMHNTLAKNGELVRHTRFAVLPDQRNEVSAVHIFAEGAAEIDAWLVLEGDNDGPSVLVAKAIETFTLTKTDRPYVAEEEAEAEEEKAEPEVQGPVTLRASRDGASKLFVVNADVLPPVKRVEFWIEGKRVLARNAPPYLTELDLGDSPNGVALRAIGFDAAGRYVDADAYVVGEGETSLAVKITRTRTPDGLSHFKLSVRNPKGTRLKSVVLYAGDRQLHAWDRPPFMLSLATDAECVRAVVIDDAGAEATDRHCQ